MYIVLFVKTYTHILPYIVASYRWETFTVNNILGQWSRLYSPDSTCDSLELSVHLSSII